MKMTSKVQSVSSLLLIGLLGLSGALLLQNAQAKSVAKPCSKMANSVKVGNTTVPTCAKFYSSKPAIKSPADSKNEKYGVVVVGESGSDSVGALYDRSKKQTSFPAKLVPLPLRGKPEAVQYLFRAKLVKSKIVKLTPVLYVPKLTMLQPFENTQFLGQVNNLTPAEGINESEFIRWHFNNSDNQNRVVGRFMNLNDSVRMSQMVEPPAPCATSLATLQGSGDWYTKILGKSDEIYLQWFPAMHTRMDSEFVVQMSDGASYMSGAPTINALLKQKMDISKISSFTIHGNPMGTPYQFTTGLGMGYSPGFSVQTSAPSC
ncbi:MAG: hypothetical protein KGQ38_04355 [Actinomycetales bacterium]|nr:hypothetical protein [Actinomycetales bacterium]